MVTTRCPNCGAPIANDGDLKSGTCAYCNVPYSHEKTNQKPIHVVNSVPAKPKSNASIVFGIIAGVLLIPGLICVSVSTFLGGIANDLISEEQLITGDGVNVGIGLSIAGILLSLIGAILSKASPIFAGFILLIAFVITLICYILTFFLSWFHLLAAIFLIIAFAKAFGNHRKKC
ncbi:MAG: hypothetical protein LBV53_03085 [Mycoplasmataceae bacterium]|jgi:hypothetical protein|nr:hypothetical protein [Mycoplasmataceae bacterium]